MTEQEAIDYIWQLSDIVDNEFGVDEGPGTTEALIALGVSPEKAAR